MQEEEFVAASSNRRVKQILSAASLVGIALLVALISITPDDGSPALANSTTPLVSGRRSEPNPVVVLQRSTSADRTEDLTTANQAPLALDEIGVEKQEVCEGEENLVRIKGHTLDGSDSFLHYVIGGQPGRAVPLRVYRTPGEGLPRQIATIFGKDGASLTVDVPYYRVNYCRPERAVAISYTARANTIDQLQFAAKVQERGAHVAPLRIVRYAWTFGDGSTAITSTPFAIHDYSDRLQTELYSGYLVEVHVFADTGEVLLGRSSVEFLNTSFQDLKKFGTVTITAKGTPRFPALSGDGVVRQTFDLWHHYSEPVLIERIRVLELGSDGRREDSGRLSGVSELTQRTIGVGERVQVELSFDAQRYPGVVALLYKLEGTSTDGRPALGEAAVMRPPPVPTRENSTPVNSRRVAAQIRRAMRILGKSSVSQEELWELERAGMLGGSQATRWP